MKADRRVCKKHSGFSGTGNYIRDVTSILQDAEGLHLAIDLMQEKLKDVEFDVVVGPGIQRIYFWSSDCI